jgi:GTP-binding protein
MLPSVAIVGKPNTGKSTLFNRLVGKKLSITFDKAGTTRDRVFELLELKRKQYILVDTAGLDFASREDLESDIRKQTEIAINESDLVLFAVDLSAPLSSDDFLAAKLLRQANKPVVLIGTKNDRKVEEYYYNTFELGFGEPICLSAVQNRGVNDMTNAISKFLTNFKAPKAVETFGRANKICFLGRPNVGKSSLMNALFGNHKVIVSDIPGTTRDSVSLPFSYNNTNFVLTDTAGLRKQGKLRYDRLEKFSVIRSLQALEYTDVGVLVLDASQELAKQDLRVSEHILEAKKGLIIVVNKADLVKPEQKNAWLRELQVRMPYAYYAPIIFTSALTGTNVERILELAIDIVSERRKVIKTRELNYFLERVVDSHPPKSGIKFTFIAQVDSEPPTFNIFMNKPKVLHFSYKRYIENEIRREYGFSGTAMTIRFKPKNELDKEEILNKKKTK